MTTHGGRALILLAVLMAMWSTLPAWAVGSVVLQPSSGDPGSSFEVVLAGWKPDETIRYIRWDGIDLATNLKVSATGSLTRTFQVPANAVGGAHLVSVRGQGPEVGATFTVIATTTTTAPARPQPTVTTTTTQVYSPAPPTATTGAGTAGTSTTQIAVSSTVESSEVTVTTDPDAVDLVTGGLLPLDEGPNAPGGGGSLWGTILSYLGVALAAGFAIWYIRWGGGPLVGASIGEPSDPSLPVAAPTGEAPSFWAALPIVIETGARIETVASREGHFLATGLVAHGEEISARVWDSVDGMEWSPVGSMEPGLVTSLTVSERIYAFGLLREPSGDQQGAVWLLEENGDWRRLTDSGSLGEIHFEQGVTLPDGFAAIARLKGGSRLFRSLDAAEWEGPHLPVLVERLFPVGGRVLGVGRRIDGRNVEVIESSDGREWTMWEPTRSLPFEMTVVDDVAEFDGGYVAGGFDRLNQTAVIWVSDDSYGWHRLRVDFGPGSEAMAIRAVDDAVFAVVTRNRSGYPPRIELWRSADAIEWAEVKGSGIDSVVPVGVTCNGGRLRVFAEVVGGGEDRRLGAWEAVLARREAAIA